MTEVPETSGSAGDVQSYQLPEAVQQVFADLIAAAKAFLEKLLTVLRPWAEAFGKWLARVSPIFTAMLAQRRARVRRMHTTYRKKSR